MTEPPSRKSSSLGEWLAQHPVVTGVYVLAAIGGIVGVGLAFYQFWCPEPPLRHEIVPLPETDATTDLSIINADVETIVRDRRFLVIIEVGADYLLSYDIAIRNTREQAMSGCWIEQSYRVSSVIGQGMLYVGSWVDWYDGQGTFVDFDLPDDPTFQGQFFSWRPENDWPLDSIRVRIICRQPEYQISPWREVDLAGVTWN